MVRRFFGMSASASISTNQSEGMISKNKPGTASLNGSARVWSYSSRIVCCSRSKSRWDRRI